jgi:hypothetical protein
MTSPFGTDGGMASLIARLLGSRGVQQGARQLGGMFQSQQGQPFRTPGSVSSFGNRGQSQDGSGAFPNIGGILGNVAKTASGLAGAAPNQQMPNDPLMDLYNQLISQLQAPVNMPTGVNTADLMEQVKKAINPIYDARAKNAEASTGRATGQVKDMYRALSNDYERLAPEQVAQAEQSKKEIEGLYGQLRSNIQGDYSRVSQEQGDLFKSLGIEAALPDVLEEQAAPVQEALTGAAENQAQQMQRQQDIGQMDATYYREGSPNATMTGNDISTEMLAELQDYLGQVEGDRASGIQSTYMDQLGQAQSQLAQQQQNATGEAGRRQEMLWQMLSSQLNAKQQPQPELTPDTFMGQLPPNMQQSVAGAFTRLQRSPEAVYGKVEDKRNPVPGTYVETTPEWYMQKADEMLQNGEIDETTHQALLMYLQLNFSK